MPQNFHDGDDHDLWHAPPTSATDQASSTLTRQKAGGAEAPVAAASIDICVLCVVVSPGVPFCASVYKVPFQDARHNEGIWLGYSWRRYVRWLERCSRNLSRPVSNLPSITHISFYNASDVSCRSVIYHFINRWKKGAKKRHLVNFSHLRLHNTECFVFMLGVHGNKM